MPDHPGPLLVRRQQTGDGHKPKEDFVAAAGAAHLRLVASHGLVRWTALIARSRRRPILEALQLRSRRRRPFMVRRLNFVEGA
jgi:hypothetical protein